jgi:hypothetical protein
MSRRIVPGSFWVGILASVLLLAGTMRASSRSGLPDMVGIWDGFFLAAGGVTGGVQSDITQQDFKRLEGDGELLGLDNPLLYSFRAKLARPDFLTGKGVTSTGRLVFQAGLATFAGLGGDAGVMAPEYRFVPSRGDASRVSALLLHPFPGVAGPDITGTFEGPFVSLPDPVTGAPADPTFRGIGRMQFSPRIARGSFGGRVELFLQPDQPPVISWPILATTSEDRRVVWIAQGKSGRIVYEAVVVPAPNAESKTTIDGVGRLLFNDGRTLFNAFNVSLR